MVMMSGVMCRMYMVMRTVLSGVSMAVQQVILLMHVRVLVLVQVLVCVPMNVWM